MGLSVTAPAVEGSAADSLRERLAPLWDPAVLGLTSVTFVGAGGGLMFYSYLAPYVVEVGGEPYVLTAAPRSGMTAIALIISGMYLGTAAGAALGGALINFAGVGYVPLVAALLMAVALGLTPRGRRDRSGHAGSVEPDGERAPTGAA